MAWFHKTLTDLKKLIDLEFEKPDEEQDWSKVMKILKEHSEIDKYLEGGMSTAGHIISQYSDDLSQISGRLFNETIGKKVILKGGDKTIMKVKVQSAIDNAVRFERILIRLIKERKFLE